MKPGYKTSEAWMALAVLILTALVASGVLTPQQSQELEEPISRLILSLTTITADVLVVWKYIQSRTAVKTAPPVLAAPPAGDRVG